MMSDFLDVLDKIELSDDSDNYQSVEQIILLRNSLGDNARRMLEIGIVQDELYKLGFKHHGEYLGCLVLEGRKLMVDLETNAAVLVWQSLIFSYKSPTWQQDLLAKVRELIGDK